MTVFPASTSRFNDAHQQADVGQVQPGGRLVHHVDAALLVQLGGELQALPFAARQRAEWLAQLQVVQPDVVHRLQHAP